MGEPRNEVYIGDRYLDMDDGEDKERTIGFNNPNMQCC
jgi:hypothetical protein